MVIYMIPLLFFRSYFCSFHPTISHKFLLIRSLEISSNFVHSGKPPVITEPEQDSLFNYTFGQPISIEVQFESCSEFQVQWTVDEQEVSFKNILKRLYFEIFEYKCLQLHIWSVISIMLSRIIYFVG